VFFLKKTQKEYFYKKHIFTINVDYQKDNRTKPLFVKKNKIFSKKNVMNYCNIAK
jgi:hypothetical protein